MDDCGQECGCHLNTFTTDRQCPACGKRLRLVGRLQRMELRLTCPDCGYTSSLLSQVEIAELL
ncbi:MAG: hypothetical protein HY670_02590 [Chloroflexi bacterium]|nr:hypothetical protein [Chloroflexota bacterium]